MLHEDAERSQRTRHTVDLAARVDRDRLAAWLAAQEASASLPSALAQDAAAETRANDTPQRLA